MISDKFPTVGKVNLATCELCDCPRRREPSAKQTTLPVPATEANSAGLQKHLVRIRSEHFQYMLNPDKFVFRNSTVDFSGFTITMTDVRPCSRYLEAIRYFPEPRNINNVRSWFRLVNQVTYAFSMAERMHPFRKLLKNGERITWWPELEDIFRESKDAIVQEIEHDVRIFETTKHTCAPSSYLFSPNRTG